MSKLSSFLKPVQDAVEKEVIISKRFVDESGNPVPFRIRALTQEENDQIVRQSTKVEFKNGQRVEYLDSIEFARRTIVAATVEPDFTDKEMCDAYGVVSPLMVPVKMLKAREYNKLMHEISGMADVESCATEEEVKN